MMEKVVEKVRFFRSGLNNAFFSTGAEESVMQLYALTSLDLSVKEYRDRELIGSKWKLASYF